MSDSRIPFPIVDGRYTVSADIRPLGRPARGLEAEHGHLRRDEAWRSYLADKLDVLERAADEALCVQTDDEAGLCDVLWEMLGVLAAELPGVACVSGEGYDLRVPGLRIARTGAATFEVVDLAPARDAGDSPEGDGAAADATLMARARGVVRGANGVRRLAHALALSVQEDLVVLRDGAQSGQDGLELLHVCFPSAWRPRDKLGLDFGAVHGPVAHNGPLLRAHHGLVRTIAARGNFVRYAWGLHRDGALCHNPALHTQPLEPAGPTPEEAAAATWFRVERQTTRAFAARSRAVFTIRVYVAPLAHAVGEDPARCTQLASALRSMDAEAIAYKGVAERREPLIAWLEARSA